MVLSDCISIIAIIVSVGSLALQLFIDWRRNKKERIRELYNQAYKDLLMNDYPSAVLSIVWTENGIKGTGKFGKVCRTLRKQSGFFRFYDEKFHKKVTDEIMSVEDFVLDFDNHKLNKEDFDYKISELNLRLKKLYELIMNRCL